VHRAAFGSERFSDDVCRVLMGARAYRRELDTVVVAPDGSFAAFALAWLDAENAVGEFEPVGTRPDQRRLGLARAAIQHGLRQLHAHGARAAAVYALGGDEGSTALYTSMGFRVVDRNLGFARIPGISPGVSANPSGV
jgi:ribosomal protein S18 acetylase RimI-like enzyme